MTRCMGCMEEISEKEEICGYCGYKKGEDIKEAYYLLPGQTIGEKYLVGKVLGYGGFGVTYIGWDETLKRKIAIKEYLPSDFATRSYGTNTLTIFSGEAFEQFQAGLNSFISEAKRLAKFNRIPEIVDIYDCFMENDTGYIIMEFLEGNTVKEMLTSRGKIPVEDAKQIIMAVLRGLSEVHKAGIIHRDIAPDNIFITKNGDIKILDFGAARYATAVQSRSLSVILKPGYAPEEQYRSRGEQGAWTDVYAVGATFYKMITGIRPEEAIERMVEDTVKKPSELGIKIDPNTENAILNSMNIRKENRIPDADSFYKALENGVPVDRIEEKMTAAQQGGGKTGRLKWSAAAAGLIAFVWVVLIAAGKIRFTGKQIDSANGIPVLEKDECYVPDISGMSYEAAETALKEKGLNVIINGMNYSESIEKDRILSQDPRNGAKVRFGETVYVIMSGGNQEVMMPDLKGMEYEKAADLIAVQNLILKKDEVIEEYSDLVEKGRVIAQNIDAEKQIKVQTEIILTVSLGSLSAETAVLPVPDFAGMTRDEAMECLEKLKKDEGFTFSIGKIEKEYSTETEKNRIIRQEPGAGNRVRTNESITLVISKGPEMVRVPELVYCSKEEAVRRLEDAGLKAEIREENSSKISKGLVISQSQDAGAKAAKGSTVVIVVSRGKEAVKASQPPAQGAEQTPQEPPAQTPQEPPAQQPDSGNGGEAVVVPDNPDAIVVPDDDDVEID